MPATVPPLYKKYHVDREYENASLFETLVERYDIQSFLYPGCYVHITPSFYIPYGVYVDAEKSAEKFLKDLDVQKFIEQRKTYTENPEVIFYHQSYDNPIDEADASIDLLISQYAGFVSEATKQYLKKGGLLVANNSHGDAGLANIDDDFKLIAVANKRDNTFFLQEDALDQYFVPKKSVFVTKDYQKQLGRGIGFKKTASHYVFEKVR